MEELIKLLNKPGRYRGKKGPRSLNLSEQTIRDMDTIRKRLGFSRSELVEWLFERAEIWMPWLVDDKVLAKLLGYKSADEMRRKIKEKL